MQANVFGAKNPGGSLLPARCTPKANIQSQLIAKADSLPKIQSSRSE